MPRSALWQGLIVIRFESTYHAARQGVRSPRPEVISYKRDFELIVTIDGPAGAGKSSIAHQVALRLGYEFLDTGAMYRAATLGAIRNGIDLSDADALVQYVQGIRLAWEEEQISLDGQDVSDAIRTPEVTSSIHFLADLPQIRTLLTQLQRQFADGRDVVTEGRDQGTDVFPDANCKIFLTASPEERARRRQAQLAKTGREMTFEEILQTQNRRDLEDGSRGLGRLRAAEDAVVLQSDGMSPEEVLSEVLRIVRDVVKRCQVENR